METQPPVHPARTVSGRLVVGILFAFGIAATAGIWTYWKLHMAPFMPLQKALAAEFEKCTPRVDGGWTKSDDKKTPPTLRIILRLPYPPDERDVRIPATIERIIALAREHIDLATYDALEIYLVHYPPEKAPQQYEFKRKIRDL